MRRAARLASALLGATLVPLACGFHPRGSLGELDQPGRLFLDADRGLSIEQPLREALRERSFSIATNRDEADIVLRVADERQSQRIVSVRSTGRVSEFELAHAVRVAIARPGESATVGNASASAGGVAPDGGASDGPDPVPSDAARRPDRVEVTREYTYDESQVLGKENEARILRDELSDELVRQIVLRTVASLATEASERRPGQ